MDAPMKTMQIGGKLRRLRQERRLTQTEMARELGISPSYLNLIESNRRPVTVRVLVQLADKLRVDRMTYGGSEPSKVRFLMNGRGHCAFYSRGKCILHAPGLKPLEGLVARHDVPPEGPSGCAGDHVREAWGCEAGERAVHDALAGASLALEGVRTATPTLENTFVALLRRNGGDTPRGQLLAVGKALDEMFSTVEYNGCIFINVAVQFPLPHDPAHVAAAEHERAMADVIRQLAGYAGEDGPAARADELSMALEGAYVTRQVTGDERTGEILGRLAEMIVGRHVGGG